MAPWRITTWVVWEKPPKGLKHVTVVTCMYGHHCDKCHMERTSLEKTILRGGTTIRREKKNNNKRKERKKKMEGGIRVVRGETKRGKKKTKLSHFFNGVPMVGVR